MHTRVNHPELVFDGGQSAMDEARAEMLKIRLPKLGTAQHSDPTQTPLKSLQERKLPFYCFFPRITREIIILLIFASNATNGFGLELFN